jgi:hypothetical protein
VGLCRFESCGKASALNIGWLKNVISVTDLLS